MILPKFDYVAPESLEEANRILAETGTSARLMSGGTDVIVAMKEKTLTPSLIVDIKNIPGLNYLEYDPDEGLKIGALTTLRTIETSAFVKGNYPAVAQAAKYVASTQIRTKATMTGNICNASPSADTPPILIALDTVLTVQGPEGTRTVPVEQFYLGFKKVDLKPGEIVTQIRIPAMKKGQCAAYIKHAVRKAMDLAITGVAVSLMVEDGICRNARIVLGAVAITPVRAPKAEQILIGQRITDELIELAASTAEGECQPISDVRASAEYRKDMVRVFTKRALKQALGQ